MQGGGSDARTPASIDALACADACVRQGTPGAANRQIRRAVSDRVERGGCGSVPVRCVPRRVVILGLTCARGGSRPDRGRVVPSGQGRDRYAICLRARSLKRLGDSLGAWSGQTSATMKRVRSFKSWRAESATGM
eukprot:360268-Rhodomonas_salina.5